ncbi:hypothetical protein [Candidatus Kuenenia stuttgartiensis]|nr:hypothetical protein [Candidatus Kuenenia stuttgartiensis]
MKLRNFALDYSNPDFVKYAESYGASGFKINKGEHFLTYYARLFP